MFVLRCMCYGQGQMQRWVGKKREAGKRDIHRGWGWGGQLQFHCTAIPKHFGYWFPMDPLVPLGQVRESVWQSYDLPYETW